MGESTLFRGLSFTSMVYNVRFRSGLDNNLDSRISARKSARISGDFMVAVAFNLGSGENVGDQSIYFR